MASVFTDSFIQDRIDAIQTIIVAIETAITSLASGTVRSYTLNTGQTTQTVTKRDLNKLEESIDFWVGRLEYWDMIKNGGGPSIYTRGY